MTMTPEELLQVAAEYADLLRAEGVDPAPLSNIEKPFDIVNDREALLSHMLWACEHLHEAINLVGGFTFCVRYLGAIQGGLLACGLLTVAAVRQRFGHFAFERELEHRVFGV